MTSNRKLAMRVLILVASGVALTGGSAQAQRLPGRPAMPQAGRAGTAGQGVDRVSPVEVQRLFEAYTIMQAGEALKLADAQYPLFLSRLKALYETRRRSQQARHQVVLELGRLSAPAIATIDEALIRERLKTLADLDSRAAAEVRSSYDALDQTLDVRQQARFRVLEEQLERRKFDLLLRARRAGQNQLGQAAPPIR